MQNIYLETQHYSQENPRGPKALTLGIREALWGVGACRRTWKIRDQKALPKDHF